MGFVPFMVHIGIDTVQLEGDGFTSAVTQGQQVLAGGLLATVDLDAVKAAGYDPTTIVVITNTASFAAVLPAEGHRVGAGGTVITIERCGRRFDTESVNAARFLTHLRYFFVRVDADAQLLENPVSFTSTIRASFPEAYQSAERLQALLELRLGKPITPDEVVHLTLHIARLASEAQSLVELVETKPLVELVETTSHETVGRACRDHRGGGISLRVSRGFSTSRAGRSSVPRSRPGAWHGSIPGDASPWRRRPRHC